MDNNKRAELIALRQLHADQVAWGAKSTRLGNQIAKLEEELQPNWLRFIASILRYLLSLNT